MDFHASLVAVCHDSHVARNYCAYARFFGSIDDGMHSVNVLAINNSVYREVGLDTFLATYPCNLFQVIYCEVIGGM